MLKLQTFQRNLLLPSSGLNTDIHKVQQDHCEEVSNHFHLNKTNSFNCFLYQARNALSKHVVTYKQGGNTNLSQSQNYESQPHPYNNSSLVSWWVWQIFLMSLLPHQGPVVGLVTVLGRMRCQVMAVPQKEGLVCQVLAASLDSITKKIQQIFKLVQKKKVVIQLFNICNRTLSLCIANTNTSN